MRVAKRYAEDKYYGDEVIPSYTTQVGTNRETGEAILEHHHDSLGDDDENPGAETFEQYFMRQKSSLIDDRDKAALLRKRRMENHKDAYVRVQFEYYDQELYKALVAAGAQAVKDGKGKVVSLELDELGPL